MEYPDDLSACPGKLLNDPIDLIRSYGETASAALTASAGSTREARLI